MGINRPQLKMLARTRMQGQRPSPILVGLVMFLLLSVLSQLIFGVLGLNVLVQNAASVTTPTPERILRVYQNFWESYRPGIFAILHAVALRIMSFQISVGFTIYALRLSRGEQTAFGNLFDGFAIFFRVLWLHILQILFITLWSMLFWFPGLIAAYRYRMALFIMIDNPEKSALACIRESAALMRGHKRELLMLDLSFLGWMLLELLLPILAAWVAPYIMTTYALYYQALLRTQAGISDGLGGPGFYEGQFTDIPGDENDRRDAP